MASESSEARGGDGSRQIDQPDRPLVTREDIFLALKCGVDVAKKRIPDEDLRRAIETVDLGRDFAANKKSVEQILFTLGISVFPRGCIEPLINPKKVGG